MSEAIKQAIEILRDCAENHQHNNESRFALSKVVAALEAMQASEPYPAEIKTWPNKIYLQTGDEFGDGEMADFNQIPAKPPKRTPENTLSDLTEADVELLRREIHNLKRHIEDYCKPANPEVVAWALYDSSGVRIWFGNEASAKKWASDMSVDFNDFVPLCRCDVGVRSL